MDAHPKQPFWHTTFAFVTAVGTLVGAIGGLVATIYATDGNDEASTPTSPPSAVYSAGPAPTSTATVKVTPRPSVTPSVFQITAGADSWWGPPGTLQGDQGGSPGTSEDLTLDWGCTEDSRGNGSKRDCGSGLIALYFDLAALPDDAPIEEAVLTLYADEGGDARVYARRAASGWSEEGSAEPECDSSDETADEATEDEWRWDVTTLVQDQLSAESENFGFCLVLKEDASVTFASREGPAPRAPVLTITSR